MRATTAIKRSQSDFSFDSHFANERLIVRNHNQGSRILLKRTFDLLDRILRMLNGSRPRWSGGTVKSARAHGPVVHRSNTVWARMTRGRLPPVLLVQPGKQNRRGSRT